MKKRYIPLAVLLITASLAGCGKQGTEPIGKTNDYMNEQEQKQLQSELDKKNRDGEAAPVPTAEPTPEPETKTVSGERNNKPDQASQSALDEAKSMIDAGMAEDAQEMLGDVDESSLSDAQKQELGQIQKKIEEEKPAGSSGDSFTAEEACRMINDRYGIQGDPGGLTAKTDSSGKQYYQLKFQYQKENVLIDVQVYSDGTIKEVSRTPIAVG